MLRYPLRSRKRSPAYSLFVLLQNLPEEDGGIRVRTSLAGSAPTSGGLSGIPERTHRRGHERLLPDVLGPQAGPWPRAPGAKTDGKVKGSGGQGGGHGRGGGRGSRKRRSGGKSNMGRGNRGKNKQKKQK